MKKLLLSSAAFVALTASQGGAADLPIPVDIPPVPVVVPFSWSGVYFGVHAGVLFDDDGDDGCDRFLDITGEGGGPATFESASEIDTIEDNGFFEFPSGRDDEDGCFDAEVSSGPLNGPDDDNPIVDAFNLDGDFIGLTGDDDDDDDLNFLAGVQVGVQQQYGRLVLGLEGDISGVFGDDDDEIEFQYFHSADDLGDQGPDDFPELEDFQGTGTVEGGDVDWISTFRARVGGAFGTEGRLLLYGTGGAALAGVSGLSGEFDKDDGKDWCNPDEKDCVFGGGTDDDIHVGIALGAGGEYAFTNTISLGLEYLFLGFDTFDIDGGGEKLTFFGDDGRSFSFDNDPDDMHVIRAKLNVRWPPAGWGS